MLWRSKVPAVLKIDDKAPSYCSLIDVIQMLCLIEGNAGVCVYACGPSRGFIAIREV